MILLLVEDCACDFFRWSVGAYIHTIIFMFWLAASRLACISNTYIPHAHLFFFRLQAQAEGATCVATAEALRALR